jgi:hypothetical protein
MQLIFGPQNFIRTFILMLREGYKFGVLICLKTVVPAGRGNRRFAYENTVRCKVPENEK